MVEVPEVPRLALPEDPHSYLPHANATDVFPEPSWLDRIGVTEREINRHNRLVANIYHRTPNGAHDPMSMMLVADALIRVKPETRIRSRYFVRHLSATKPFFLWEAQTVGRLLNSISERATAEYERYRWTPVHALVDSRGNVFVVRRHPESYRWLWKVISGLSVLTQRDMQKEALDSQLTPRKHDPINLVDTEPVNPEDLQVEYP